MDSSRRLVLLGGGHAMLPSLAGADAWTQSGVEVTLVDPQRWLYYSGMVPEHLGGVYPEEKIRIDLARLARRGGVRFVSQAASEIDPENRVVRTAAGRTFPFDVLAVDVGAVNPAVPDGAVATKPISRTRDLTAPIRRVLDDQSARLRLVVVGGGAAGTEIALNVSGRFQGAGRLGDLDLTIVEQAGALLPGFPPGLQAHTRGLLRRRGAMVQLGTTVEAVRTAETEAVVETDGGALPADAVLWATGTVGPPFLRESGLATDDRGFLHVESTLRIPTHPRIFAAGDCATLLDRSLAKVGVHAVKQGPDLQTNLDRTLRGLAKRGRPPPDSALDAFRPYPVAPLILSTGGRDGLWTAGPLWGAHPWLLRLKHAIDRRWIRNYAPEHWGEAGWRTLLGAEAAASAQQ